MKQEVRRIGVKRPGMNGVVKRVNHDEGVASVVALMLLLAVIVTFLSLYATTYLPALKQQAEIGQISSVKEAFMRFDNDMEHILSEKKDASYGEMIPLGGGDILLSPEKTSGTLSVGEPELLFTITDNTESSGYSIVNVRYGTSFSYWEEQGYSWQHGYLNVTKGQRSTPLSYFTMEDMNSSMGRMNGGTGYAGSFLEISGTPNTTAGYLGGLDVTAVTIGPGERTEASGNGACVLRVRSNITTETREISSFEVSFPEHSSAGSFVTPLTGKTKTSLSGIADQFNGDGGDDPVTYDSSQNRLDFISEDHPVTLVLHRIEITVSVQ